MFAATKEQRRTKLEHDLDHGSPGRDASMAVTVNVAPVQHALIVEEVRSCLKSSSYAPIRLLNCGIENGAVVLHGQVPSYYLKQIAQELVRRLRRTQPILNAVKVTSYETY